MMTVDRQRLFTPGVDESVADGVICGRIGRHVREAGRQTSIDYLAYLVVVSLRPHLVVRHGQTSRPDGGGPELSCSLRPTLTYCVLRTSPTQPNVLVSVRTGDRCAGVGAVVRPRRPADRPTHPDVPVRSPGFPTCCATSPFLGQHMRRYRGSGSIGFRCAVFRSREALGPLCRFAIGYLG